MTPKLIPDIKFVVPGRMQLDNGEVGATCAANGPCSEKSRPRRIMGRDGRGKNVTTQQGGRAFPVICAGEEKNRRYLQFVGILAKFII